MPNYPIPANMEGRQRPYRIGAGGWGRLFLSGGIRALGDRLLNPTPIPGNLLDRTAGYPVRRLVDSWVGATDPRMQREDARRMRELIREESRDLRRAARNDPAPAPEARPSRPTPAGQLPAWMMPNAPMPARQPGIWESGSVPRYFWERDYGGDPQRPYGDGAGVFPQAPLPSRPSLPQNHRSGAGFGREFNPGPFGPLGPGGPTEEGAIRALDRMFRNAER